MVLIYETRPSSPWRPYIDVLPASFNTLMYWTNDELSELQASAVVAKIGKQDADELFRDKLWPIVKVSFSPTPHAAWSDFILCLLQY